jgi:hypothetical protein
MEMGVGVGVGYAYAWCIDGPDGHVRYSSGEFATEEEALGALWHELEDEDED